MNVAFTTLGCKVNTYESAALEAMFQDAGFSVVDAKDVADVYIINTCTVTNAADAKSRKAIRRAVRQNPEAVVGVIGCYSQLESEAVAAIEGVDIIMGTSERGRLLDNVNRFLREREPLKEVKDFAALRAFDQLNVSSFSDNTRAFLKIQDGCNQYCSFCIIPYARGPVRSRPMDDVLDEAKRLISAGYQEIVLTGIHTGGYGQDLDETRFYDLLKAMTALEGLVRLRISSIEINQLSDDILDLIATNKVFARHLHIPIQSGSDGVLRRMRRRYSVSAFSDRLKAVRTRLPDVAITTDVIVGFPGETEDEFLETKATLERLAFSELHVFPYSKRSGTKAAAFSNHVHGTVKTLRAGELGALNEMLAKRFAQARLDDVHDVLFERCDGSMCEGHTSHYLRVRVETDKHLENTVCRVKLTKPDYPQSLATFVEK